MHTTLQAQNRTQKESHIKRRRKRRSYQRTLKPYPSPYCQGKDIHQLDKNMRNKLSLSETEAKGLCIDCTTQTNNQNLRAISQTITEGEQKQRAPSPNNLKEQGLEQIFMKKLEKRARGLIQSKIAETERLEACVKGDRNWFAKKAPKVDWSLMKEVCKKDKKALGDSIRRRWPDMRINMALTSANPNQFVEGKPNLNFPLKHEVSAFGSIAPLTKPEQEKAKKAWARHLSQGLTSKKLNGHQFEEAFLRVDNSYLTKNLNLKDRRDLRKATFDMHQASRDRYRQILEEMPLLAYLKTGNPNNQKDMKQAFSKMKEELNRALKRISQGDIGDLLAFGPLVEELLQESQGGYCLVAERASVIAKKEERAKSLSMFAFGMVSALPCFVGGPAGAIGCLGAGLAVGGVGYAVAKRGADKSLGRFLTGKEYERMADLAERDKEKFWELVLIPTAGFGTTAGAIKGVKALVQKTNQKAELSLANSLKKRQSLAESSLFRALNQKELSAIERAHFVGSGKIGPDGSPAQIGNYTKAQLRKKHQILKSAGFSNKDIRELMEKGVVGDKFSLSSLPREGYSILDIKTIQDKKPELLKAEYEKSQQKK